MILEFCAGCDKHDIKEDKSFCEKENCFSVHAECIHDEAVKKFLRENEVKSIHLIHKIKNGCVVRKTLKRLE